MNMRPVAAPASSRAGAGLALLIVDDETEVAHELADAAEAQGYLAHVARSAEEALAMLARHPGIGVMVSDIRMPDRDGLDLTRRVLDGRAEGEAIEVILITGHATIDDAISAVRIGAFDFLRKPFRLAELFDAIARAMGRAIGRRRLADRGMGAATAEPGPPRAALPFVQALMHELRTPLVPIVGFGELLDSARNLAEAQEFGRHIMGGARQLLDTVEDLILLVRIQRGEAKAAATPLQPAAALEAAVESRRPALAQLGIGIEARCATQALVLGEATMLRRGTEILLWLAGQSGARGGLVRAVLTEREGWVVLDIAAPPPAPGSAQARALLDHRAAAQQMAPLGLALVEAVAKCHGGHLAFAKGVGVGFGASLQLPRAAQG